MPTYYVDDLIDALLLAMDSPADFTGPENLGNPREFTILELAEIVLHLTGSRSKLVRHRCPNTIRASASRTLRWRSRRSAGRRRSRSKTV